MRILTAALVCTLAVLSFTSTSAGETGNSAAQDSAERLAGLRAAIEKDNRANPTASVQKAQEGLALLVPGQDPEAEAWFLRALVRDLNILGDFAKADAFLERCRSLAARTGDPRQRLLMEVEAVALLANSERVGEAKRILDPLVLDLESYRESHRADADIARALGRSLRILASMQQIEGKFHEAIRTNQSAQKLFGEVGDQRGQSRVLANMGLIYIALGRHDEAEASYKQAIALAERISDQALQAQLHLELANVYAHLNNPGAELGALTRASTLAAKAQDSYLQLLAAANMSDAHLRGKDYQAALSSAETALASPEIARYPAFVAGCQVNRGIALDHLGHSAAGIRGIQQGLAYYRASQARNETAEVTGNLAEAYANAGDFRRAYGTAQEFKKLSDELRRTEDQRRIADASAAFESDKKQAQIEFLQRERHDQARFKQLWIALGVLGFSLTGLLVVSRRKLMLVNSRLTELNGANLALIGQLQRALAEVRTLQGLIPICAACKRIRDDQGFWNQLELYLQSHSEATFSHGLCPECATDFLADLPQKLPADPPQVPGRSRTAE